MTTAGTSAADGLLTLGILGEYVGRMFLTVNQRPQAVVREILTSERERA